MIDGCVETISGVSTAWTGAFTASANVMAGLGGAMIGCGGGADMSAGEAGADGGFSATVGRRFIASTFKSSASIGGGSTAGADRRSGVGNPITPTARHAHHNTIVATGKSPAACSLT